LFLDVDGTLLELEETPGDVVASRETIDLLAATRGAFGGAVALLSGRAVDDLDRIFDPLKLPCAGAHGGQRRAFDGSLHAAPSDREFLEHARIVLADLAKRHLGAILEDKGLALAFHVRRSPGAAPEAADLVKALADMSAGRYSMQRGKAVFELKPASVDKGTALVEFMTEAPFRGRRPVVIGDDLTDADAFRAAALMEGISVGVGVEAPPAMYRLDGSIQCRRWLAELIVPMAIT
jgi:trehalose 6-phosphate phosphatase